MNRMFTIVKAITALLLLSFTLHSKASLIGDEICFSAMQGPPSPPILCERIIVQDPAPPAPIEIEIVQLQLASAQPIAPDSFFDIFVDIDIKAESISFDFSQQASACMNDPQVNCPSTPPPPPPWELWFQDLDWWLDPIAGIPMDGYIDGLWLMWGSADDQMVDIVNPLPEFGGILNAMGFGFLPHEIHAFIDIINLLQTFQVTDAGDLPLFELHIHTRHDIPEPSILLLLTIAMCILMKRHWMKGRIYS